jgi:hypothetical protein
VNKFRKPLIVLASMALATALTSCSADSPSPTSDASLTLRTYTVPQGDAQALSGALNHVLGLDNYRRDIGRTYWSGPGQVLVLAPAPLQDSIANSIKEMVGETKLAANARPLRLNFWVVDVYQGIGAVDPNLKPIQPALQSFEEDSGPAHFTQKHYFTALSDSGADTTMSPLPYYDLEYSITDNRDRLMFKFDYRHHFVGQPAEMLSGQVTTQLGQTLVLGLLAGPSAGGQGKTKLNRAADDAQQAGLSYKLLVMRIVPAT